MAHPITTRLRPEIESASSAPRLRWPRPLQDAWALWRAARTLDDLARNADLSHEELKAAADEVFRAYGVASIDAPESPRDGDA